MEASNQKVKIDLVEELKLVSDLLTVGSFKLEHSEAALRSYKVLNAIIINVEAAEKAQTEQGSAESLINDPGK